MKLRQKLTANFATSFFARAVQNAALEWTRPWHPGFKCSSIYYPFQRKRDTARRPVPTIRARILRS